jgi:flagellar FliJ protein
MRWADQLIKLSNFELEILQVRLANVVERRTAAEMRLVMLTAEGEGEADHARRDPEAARLLPAFIVGLKARKRAVQQQIELLLAEEAGARDALSEAFETLKKYEQVAESARLVAARETARREAMVLDELGMRQAAGRR